HLYERPSCFRGCFLKQFYSARSCDPPAAQRGGHQQLFCQICGQVTGHAVHIYTADIDHKAAAHGDPGSTNPFEVDVPVDEDMKMRVAVFLEFEDSNVLRSDSELALQINAQFREGLIQITNGIALNFLW